MLEHPGKSEQRTAAFEREYLAAYEAHADSLFRHCLIRVRDRELAKDVVAETFTKTWDYLAKGKKVDHLRAFLYRVANNLIVDQARRKRTTSLDTMMEEDGYEVLDESLKNPEDIPAARALMQILTQLEPQYRQVITMRFMDSLTPKEIALALQVSENVVSVRLHRAMTQLKNLANKPPERVLD
jgi:RNA polymerase sigma-70 factor (ECF subfamily)